MINKHGEDSEKLEAFMRKHDVREKTIITYACVQKLFQPRHNCWTSRDKCLCFPHAAMDHVKLFGNNQRMILVSQPYDWSPETEAEVLRLALKACLRLTVTDKKDSPGWWNPGQTYFVEIERMFQ